jgi:type IV pilus assembly protein PilY1
MMKFPPIVEAPGQVSPKRPQQGVRARALGRLLAAFGLVALSPSNGHAQADVNPPLPNVLLLVDTSGSMEYKLGSTSFPSCTPSSASPVSEKSRWIELVETLTGSISDYRCERIDRTAASFASSRYGTTGPLALTPYDYLYENPYHRPLSGTCAPYPGAVDANAYVFPNNAINYHPYSSTATTCTFPDASDGILDAFERAVRFGLMTFDTQSNAGTGVSGTAPVHSTGIQGTWSYIAPPTTANLGMPAGCVTPVPFEVGARNAAAPAWEGRMVPFGNPDAGSLDYLTKKSQIEKILMATRPYGATPIAGMMEDASDFFLVDNANDPITAGQKFGPKDDPYVAGGCRRQYMILLSDGQPNLELRAPPGEDPSVYCSDAILNSCPFRKPEVIATDLAAGPRPIYTFVVGFALSSFSVGAQTKTCNDLTDDDFKGASGLCQNPLYFSNTALQACCSLNRIAINGAPPSPNTTRRAYFAANKQELTSALSQILTEITPVTSRTQPVVSGAAGGSNGFRFYSSVRPVSFQPWVGVLERQRYLCKSTALAGGGIRNYPEAQTISATAGDDFAANLNSGLGRARTFYTVEGGIGSEAVYSDRTIRPSIPTASGDPDGVGTYKGEQYSGNDASFVSSTKVEAIQIQGKCPGLSDTLCRDRHLKWLVGLPNGTPYSRCTQKNTKDCYLFGDILHSTPQIVGPPGELLRDQSYAAFKKDKAKRPVVLYTSTNDGFLHAFKVTGTVDDMAGSDAAAKVAVKTNNELWAFVPPGVLPLLSEQYPFTHQLLLDGMPVVKDVVATVTGTGGSAVISLERTGAQASAGGGSWRTILVQSFGAARAGYFALDVTDPDQLEDYASSTPMGPRFLWQLTTDVSGTVKLFGKSGGAPLITTLYMDLGGGPKEIPVAVLPGGRGNVDNPLSQCPAAARVWSGVDGSFPPRGKVRCYTGSDNVAARSLTIVRLDTGEIIRTFRQAATEIVLPSPTAQTTLRAKVITAPLDSPITGQPVAFPPDVGAVADRVFVGDQDGRIWKVNLASTNPSNWTMSLFFDAYPATYGTDPNFPNAYDAGQPLILPPTLSVDVHGDVTLNVATGDQDTLGAAAGMKNFVWSLTEKTNSDKTPANSQANWFQPLTGGERVVGPMSLFNSALYFASYSPPVAGASVCSNGTSKVWGMHYVLPTTGTGGVPLVNQGGRAQLPGVSGLVQSLTAAAATGDANATIFGVTVAQQPTCSTATETSDGSSFGSGTHTSVTNVNPGKFQLIMHTGSGGTQVDGGSSRVATIPLNKPVSASRIESWASLIE